jgi:NAD(P)-dependent dehydrogenase (short-subunit alcohol dehydrogenase family)
MMSQNSSGADLAGRVALVTGASSGIGLAAALGLAGQGVHVLLAGRDPDRLHAAAEKVRKAGGRNPESYRADFTRLDDVRELADKVRREHHRIDVLANNAGGIVMKPTRTPAGYETMIQVNHLAGFLLGNLLREELRGGRMINTSSDSYRDGRLDPADLNGTNGKFHPGGAYGASKQANILFAQEASRRWPDIFSASFHPGQVRTRFGSGSAVGLFFRFAPFLKSPARGADTLVWLASAPRDQLAPGAYYIKRAVREPQEHATDPELAAGLWDASLDAVGLGSSTS